MAARLAGIEFDEDWRVMAMTLVNVKSLVERDGELNTPGLTAT